MKYFKTGTNIFCPDKRSRRINTANLLVCYTIFLKPLNRMTDNRRRPGIIISKFCRRRNGTSAPNLLATSAISGSSVDTITWSKHLLWKAASIDQAMIGFPQNSRIFFRGILLLPPRAGMTASRITTHLLVIQPVRYNDEKLES